jgi:ribosomal protein S21
MSLNKEIEGYETKSAKTQAEIVELQLLIEDLHLKIVVGNNNCEEATKRFEAKILALGEAKADQERQFQRQARNIKELENAEPGKKNPIPASFALH